MIINGIKITITQRIMGRHMLETIREIVKENFGWEFRWDIPDRIKWLKWKWAEFIAKRQDMEDKNPTMVS